LNLDKLDSDKLEREKMHSGKNHGHCEHHSHQGLGNIRFAFILNFAFSLIEFVGGAWVGSMAIMANAIHDLGDSVSLGMAWGLEHFANRGNDKRFNFGYRRFSLLSALISGLVISIGSLVIIYESIGRFHQPHEPPSGVIVSAFATIGLLVNALAAWRLSHGGTQNDKMLTWHSIGDMLGWGSVLIGGIAMSVFEVAWLDPLLAIGLAAVVVFNVVRYLKHTAYLFLQGRPASFDEELFIRETLAIRGVEKVDNLAVWSLDGRTNILTARLHLHSLRDPLDIERAKSEARQIANQHGARATLETCLANEIHKDES
jgi:cobalt-zinc-cadmium efflux system protein